MTDDLVKRLRSNELSYRISDTVERWDKQRNEAADRIEKLEAELVRTFKHMMRDAKRIEKLEAALRVYAEEDHWSGDKFEPIRFPEGECVCCYEHFSDQGEIARKALEGES
jgi:hypothetical protein